MKQLSAKANWLFFLRIFPWFIIAVIFVFPTFAFSGLSSWYWYAGYCVVAPFIAFIWADLTRRSHKYQLTEKGLYREYGVILRHKILFPYEEINELHIANDLLARMMHLCEVVILGHTPSTSVRHVAPGAFVAAGSHPSMSRRIPGLDPVEAEKLKQEVEARTVKVQDKEVRKKVRKREFKKKILLWTLVAIGFFAFYFAILFI